MDSSKTKSDSLARVIKNFYEMPWLKKNASTQNDSHRTIGPHGEVLSLKKTDEDYFPGTREQKRAKKKKEKKEKSPVIINNLEDLFSLKSEKLPPASSDSREELDPCSNLSSNEQDPLIATVTMPTVTVWSKDASTADKLFPNVESVRIDRTEEEELLSRAIAESIATIQLEQFKRPTILEENRWEDLYGDADDEDEGGWNNVRRNRLPSPLQQEPSSSGGEATAQKSCDDNNNSSKPGILRNKHNNLNRSLTEPDSLDFVFRKLSESLKLEIKAGRSLKSVSFSKTLDVKTPSSASSENDEPEKKIANGSAEREPNIDKYGRIDGYSERRLFMGKGARMKELEYIQRKQQNLAPKMQEVTPETETPKETPRPSVKNLPKESEEPKGPGETEGLNHDEDLVEEMNDSNSKSTLDNTESSVSIESEPESSAEAESKEKIIETPEETEPDTLCEEPIRKIEEIVVNNRKIELVSCSTQTIDDDKEPEKEKTLEDLQNDIEDQEIVPNDSTPMVLTLEKVSEKQILEKESDSVGRCLVPTLIREDNFKAKISTSFQYTDPIEVEPEAVFWSPACQNLWLTGALCQDASFEAQSSQITSQNFQNQNYFVPDSAPFNALSVPYQTLANVQQIHQLTNYHARPTLPNYIGTSLPFQEPEYAFGREHANLQNLTYQIGDGFGNHNTLLKPIERREDFLPGRESTQFACEVRPEDDQRRFVPVGAPPGFVKKLQLPPGFTRSESVQRNKEKDKSVQRNKEKDESSFKNFRSVKDEVHQKESTPSQSNNRPGGKHQSKGRQRQKSQAQAFPKQKISKSETGPAPQDKRGKSARRSGNKSRRARLREHREKIKSGRGPRSQKDATEERSSTPEDSTAQNSTYNNYLTSYGESMISELDHQAVSSPSQCQMPVVYQVPNQQSPEFGYATNWQYHMNPAQMPINFIPSYQCVPLIPNLHNVAPGSLNPVMYQQLQSQMLNPMQAAVNSVYPHASMTEGMNIVETGINCPEINSPEINSLSVDDPSVKMVHAGILRCQLQRSAVENHNSADDNFNQVPMAQSAPKINVGRGRGRLTKNDFT